MLSIGVRGFLLRLLGSEKIEFNVYLIFYLFIHYVLYYIYLINRYNCSKHTKIVILVDNNLVSYKYSIFFDTHSNSDVFSDVTSWFLIFVTRC